MKYQELLKNNPSLLDKFPEVLNITKAPMESYKKENHWVCDSLAIPTSLQAKVDELLDKVYIEYPNRIIIGFARSYPSLATKLKNIRKELNDIEAKAFFEHFGFYYDIGPIAGLLARYMKNEEDTVSSTNTIDASTISLDKVYFDNHWHSLSGKSYKESDQVKIDIFFNKVLTYYPSRKVIGLSSEHKKFAEGTAVTTRRLAGFADGSDGIKAFFADYGFEYISKNQLASDKAKENREKLQKEKEYKNALEEEALLNTIVCKYIKQLEKKL